MVFVNAHCELFQFLPETVLQFAIEFRLKIDIT